MLIIIGEDKAWNYDHTPTAVNSNKLIKEKDKEVEMRSHFQKATHSYNKSDDGTSQKASWANLNLYNDKSSPSHIAVKTDDLCCNGKSIGRKANDR